MAQAITLEHLAEVFHLSQSHLSHLFKGITGSSVMGYLNAHRFQTAKGLLAKTEYPIGRILEECGEVASEVNHFEKSGIKTLKHGEPSKQHLADEIKQ